MAFRSSPPWSAALITVLFFSARTTAQPLAEMTHNDESGDRRSGLQARPLALQEWQPDNVRQVNAADVIEQPKPSGMPVEPVRTNAVLTLAGGSAVLLCPSSGAQRDGSNSSAFCGSSAGTFLALKALHRAETWFAWGGWVEALSVGQMWRGEDIDLSLIYRALSGRIVAELHPVIGSRFDPYFGIGLGVGIIASRAAGTDNASSTGSDVVAHSLTTWSPSYALHLGLDVQLSERFKLGAVADWSNYQALTGENCAWKAFGMCSSTNWAAFSSDNALWKAGVALSFAFGQEL